MKKYTFYVLLASIVLSAGAFTLTESPYPIPSIKVVDMSNKEVDLKTIAAGNKTTIYSFWATWCGPCKQELASYSSKVAEWKKKYNADFYAVSVDQEKTTDDLKNFMKSRGWNLNTLLDNKGMASQFFKISSIPFLIVVDKKGNVVHKQVGYDPNGEAGLEKRLEEIK